MFTFVFESGKVLTIRANSRKEAMNKVEKDWYKDIFHKENFACYKNTGWSVV